MAGAPPSLVTALQDRYRLERELGAGGMATVYLAEDLRHRRRVAVKLLRPEIAATLGANRFSHEIEVAARLQHPHILPLLDSGETEGFYYYVMPFVEGESLRDRLAREGELPVHDAVKVLTEVVDALAYAHSCGVVHRDIKPDNIMISGRHVLVTDFGVAKAVSEATGRQTLTTAGVALGTPTYMAPEQAVADPHIDHRADIYAVGVLGYELLTGQPPFSAKTPQAMLAAHVTQEPEPLDRHRQGVSPALTRVLMKCLAKRPADRWQTAEELLAQLEPLATPSGGMTPTQSRPAVAPRGRPRWIWWAAGAAVMAVVAALLMLWPSPRGPTIVLGKRVAVAAGPELETWPSLSPDGSLVAYTRRVGAAMEAVVRQVEGGAPVVLTSGSQGLHGFGALSPDGNRMLILSNEGIEVIPTLGGQSRLVALVAVPRWASERFGGGGGIFWAATWNPGGDRIAFSVGDSVFLQGLDGSARTLLTVGRQLHSPAWSQDGEWIAYVEGNPGFHTVGNLAPSGIRVARASGGEPVQVTESAHLNTSPVWVPGRHALLFISDREGGRDIYELYLTRSGQPAGAPVRLTTGLSPERLSISADGRRLAWSVYTESANVWSLPVPIRDSVPLTSARRVTTGTQNIENIAVSRDGRWLYYDSDLSGNQDIWRQPLDGGAPEQLTTDTAGDFDPQVSPDGREVAFHSFRTGNRDVFVMRATGGGEVQVTTSPQSDWNPTWGLDGQTLIWDQQLHLDSVLWTARRGADGSWGPPQLVTTTIERASIPRLSPDGRCLAFVTPEGLRVLERATGKIHLVDPLGSFPAWGGPGNTLYFATVEDAAGQFTMKAVPADGGTPRTLAYGNDPLSQGRRYGLAVNGERLFLPLVERNADIWVAEIREE